MIEVGYGMLGAETAELLVGKAVGEGVGAVELEHGPTLRT
jgi:hypothetical protein